MSETQRIYIYTERTHCIPGKRDPEHSVPRQTFMGKFLQPGKKIKSLKRGIKISVFCRSNTYKILKERQCDLRILYPDDCQSRVVSGNWCLSWGIYKRTHFCQPRDDWKNLWQEDRWWALSLYNDRTKTKRDHSNNRMSMLYVLTKISA